MSEVISPTAPAPVGANGTHGANYSVSRWLPLPDHTQLPDSDGAIVENYLELPQSIMLTTSIIPMLNALHPDGQYSIGQDNGIYWNLTDPPLKGCKAPDWFYVPGVPPSFDGKARRSYVLWKEIQRPLIAIEYVSGDGSVELDRTPHTGKFWVYEKGIQIPYYVVWDAFRDRLQGFHLADLEYRPLPLDEHGRLHIAPLNLDLGIWRETYMAMDGPWLRWFDAQGTMLPFDKEIAERETQRADQERQRADREKQRADLLAAKLRELGLNPDAL